MKKVVKKTMLIILLSIGSLIILTFASLLLISGVFEKQEYLEPWEKDYALQFEDPRIQLAAHGLLAGNGHNMQPWMIKLDKENPMVFYLYSDSNRMTGEVDPFSRQMMVTQGAFLEYVKIAGNYLGYPASVELFPQGVFDETDLIKSMQSTPVAKVTLTKASPQQDPLYDYLFMPDTNRSPYKPEQLTMEQVSELEAVSKNTGIIVKIFQDSSNIAKLKTYIMDSVTIEANTDRVMEETEVIFRSNEFKKNQYRYGFSVEGQGTSGIMRHIIQGLVTLFPSMNSGEAATTNFIKSTQTSVDNTAAYAMIFTKDNSRISQVESGMIYSNLVLTAHKLGVVMQPLSQPLEEYPEMNLPYTSIHKDYAMDGSTIQMLLRLGQPTKDVPLSMRQDVMEIIE
ncbi:MAG: hypothetical protein K0R21_113 [Anaerocolumna sp.]|jgi:hypothetical protein|nr:hypothetical protein [Anaerocolumna sp.]